MTSPGSSISDPQTILQALRRAVHKALERKRRLHQYMVIWVDHRPQCIGPDAPSENSMPADQRQSP